MLVLLAALNAVAPPPTLRFCSGSVCAGYGAPLVLEAAQALTCSPECDIKVATATCMKACNKVPLDAVAVFSNGAQKLLDPCTSDPEAALRVAFDALGEPALEPMRSAFASKLRGDRALLSGDSTAAMKAFTAAIDGAPRGLLESMQCAAASVEPAPPPSLRGLGPSRLAMAVAKERERTMPGHARWLFEALVGRSYAQLGQGTGGRKALEDARQATLLCPLAPRGWEALQDAASAAGESELAEQAGERAAATRAEGMAEGEALAAERAVSTSPASACSENAAVQKPKSNTRAALAYGAAISLILSAIAYRKQPGNGVADQ